MSVTLHTSHFEPRRGHRNRTRVRIPHVIYNSMGGFMFQCGGQWRIMRPRMWSGTVHVGFNVGTRGSYGTVRSTRDVMSDTGLYTCGPCGVQVLHNSPSATATIATIPHPTRDIMVVGALCTFPSQATLGDIFRSTSTYASSENNGTLHVHVNVYLSKYRPVTDSNGKISTVPGRHHQSYLDLRLGNPPGFLKMSQLASPRRALS